MDDDVWRRGGGAVAEVWGNRAAILLRWLLEEEEEEDGGLGSLERVWLLLLLLPVEVEEGGVRQADRVDPTADCGKQNSYNTNDGKGRVGQYVPVSPWSARATIAQSLSAAVLWLSPRGVGCAQSPP